MLFKAPLHGTGFEGMKGFGGQPRLGTVRGQETVGEGAALLQWRPQNLKRSQREAAAWHSVVESKLLKRAQRRLPAKVQPQCS